MTRGDIINVDHLFTVEETLLLSLLNISNPQRCFRVLSLSVVLDVVL